MVLDSPLTIFILWTTGWRRQPIQRNLRGSFSAMNLGTLRHSKASMYISTFNCRNFEFPFKHLYGLAFWLPAWFECVSSQCWPDKLLRGCLHVKRWALLLHCGEFMSSEVEIWGSEMYYYCTSLSFICVLLKWTDKRADKDLWSPTSRLTDSKRCITFVWITRCQLYDKDQLSSTAPQS